MSRSKLVLLTHGRESAYIEPASYAVRAAVRRVGCSSMIDPSTRALAVPIRWADDVEAALVSAGLRVDVVLGPGPETIHGGEQFAVPREPVTGQRVGQFVLETGAEQ